MNKFGIVVIGYNRVDSIQRLVTSLLGAAYKMPVDLIISIDNSGTTVVEDYAKTIQWTFGKKIIKTFPQRLGLKKHVLTCGSYMNEYQYDAIIVLEDDLFVAPGFFNFALQAVEKYKNDSKVAGISLYSHSWNINADRPFTPLYKGSDIFFMQYPQSWGQVWMKDQWNAFYDWYTSKAYERMDLARVPDNVLGWPESSWLKHHVQYCIDTNKFFVYPYHSLTTNYADAGTHYAFSTNKMQIPLDMSPNKAYCFPEALDSTAVYDAYYENMQLSDKFNLKPGELEVDLFGMKKKYIPGSRYLLTTTTKNFALVKTFGLQMRPWELNVIYKVPGNDIFLYDLTQKDQRHKQKHLSLIHWIYDTRGQVILKRNFIDIMFNEVLNKIRKK